ncbi:MAG: hypothetical protein A2007_05070 [Verrucomicrobia bacterium GWC2_42_7]|nr:MAG: hypothetical protein A2007_05070 [Verrucomicrobia bacterium GWC2_42_7]
MASFYRKINTISWSRLKASFRKEFLGKTHFGHPKWVFPNPLSEKEIRCNRKIFMILLFRRDQENFSSGF